MSDSKPKSIECVLRLRGREETVIDPYKVAQEVAARVVEQENKDPSSMARARWIQESGVGPAGYLTVQQAAELHASHKRDLANREEEVERFAAGLMRHWHYQRRAYHLDHAKKKSSPVRYWTRGPVRNMSLVETGESEPQPRRDSRGSDWTVSELQHELVTLWAVDVSHRTLQRWAASGKIPGAYPLKHGHYRVRRCLALARWIANIHFDDIARNPKDGRAYENALLGYTYAVAIHASDDPAKAARTDPRLSKTPLAFLDADTFDDAGKKKDEYRLRAYLDWRLSRGVEKKDITTPAVAKALGIPRATFYRKDFHLIVNGYCGIKPTAQETKDPRAKTHRTEETQEDETEDGKQKSSQWQPPRVTVSALDRGDKALTQMVEAIETTDPNTAADFIRNLGDTGKTGNKVDIHNEDRVALLAALKRRGYTPDKLFKLGFSKSEAAPADPS